MPSLPGHARSKNWCWAAIGISGAGAAAWVGAIAHFSLRVAASCGDAEHCGGDGDGGAA